jgi:hypothetical protein
MTTKEITTSEIMDVIESVIEMYNSEYDELYDQIAKLLQSKKD